ncbi:hypothetical protein ACFSX9_13205 [Flavobacterium ardleyense]|uniref:DUF3592 domain containing protein n=1 Tax=Flavobacterium ardleyense TaxID=2038737 RepID=A0ABW5Z9Z5_9FLAO
MAPHRSIFIFISFIIFVICCKSLFNRLTILKLGTKTTAKLVGLDQTTFGVEKEVMYRPVIEFYDNGILIEQTLNQSMPSYINGKQIYITFLKTDDKYQIINHETKAYFHITIALTFICAFIIIYLFVNHSSS